MGRKSHCKLELRATSCVIIIIIIMHKNWPTSKTKQTHQHYCFQNQTFCSTVKNLRATRKTNGNPSTKTTFRSRLYPNPLPFSSPNSSADPSGLRGDGSRFVEKPSQDTTRSIRKMTDMEGMVALDENLADSSDEAETCRAVGKSVFNWGTAV